jgi:hypothetical protein
MARQPQGRRLSAADRGQRAWPGVALLLGTLVAGGCAAAAAGCRLLGFYPDDAANPIEDAPHFAVAPVAIVADGGGHLDPVALGDILAAELVQFPRVERVTRPLDVLSIMREENLTLDDELSLRRLARRLNADGIVLVTVTEFDPYYMPRVAAVARLYLLDPPLAARGGQAMVELGLGGRATPARFDLGGLVEVERVLDSSQRETFDIASRYSRRLTHRGDAVAGVDRLLNLPELYFQFVSNRLVTALFEEFNRRVEEEHGFKS